MRRAGRLAILLAIAAGPALAQAPVAEPDGYRMEDYRAPAPATLSGARTIATAQAHAIWKAGEAAFIDVLPHPPRPTNLPAGTIWRERDRLDIPGSVWLPDTGYGELTPASWNAGKRALALGYRNVAWYPDGTDGWHEAELPMEKATPMTARPGE
jgi:hypothetical protein